MEPVKLSIVGVGGYAPAYTRSADHMEKEGMAIIKSVVVRNRPKYPEQVTNYEERGIPIRASFEEMLELDAPELDIIGIPTGIDQHRRMMIAAADAGCHTVLEKPPAAVIQDMDAMIGALDRNERWCQVGFQNQSRTKVKRLKRLICDGKLGKIDNVVVKGMKPTSSARWQKWYGQLKIGDTWILDGDMNNPYAHYLMNGLYFASAEWQTIARPVAVRAELYKGWDIPSEDTSCVEIVCDNGAVVYFFCTLCPEEREDQVVEIVGEKGQAVLPANGDVQITYSDGTTAAIAEGDENHVREVHMNAARYLRGMDDELNCPLQMTRNYTLAINGAFESSGGTHKIPDDMLKITRDEESDTTRRIIPGINDLIARCFEQRKLFSDMGVPWGVATQPFSMENYTHFDMPVEE